MKRPAFISEEQWAKLFPEEAKKKPNKYHAKKVKLDGHTFDSKLEAERYAQLKLMQAQGMIDSLQVHPKYPLVVNGVKIGRYTPDFAYYRHGSNALIVEDTKGVITEGYRLRKKLLKALYDLDVIEVRKPSRRKK